MKIGFEFSTGGDKKPAAPAPVKRGFPRIPVSQKRSFTDVSDQQSTLADWLLSDAHTNQKLQNHLPRLRRMCRGLEESNRYYRRFLAEWVLNIIGPAGFRFQSECRRANGEPDKTKRDELEGVYREWQNSMTAWACGMPYVEGLQLAERTFARDGMALIRILRGYSGNRWGFALQHIDIDYLDINLTGTFKVGGRTRDIHLGIEVDQYGKPAAYYLRGQHGGEDLLRIAGRNVLRVPASDMLCRVHKERPEQMHGVPMAVGAITALRHLDRYEEAEVVAARVAACASISIENDGTVPQFEGEDGDDLTAQLEMAPGGFLELPGGKKATLLSPQHPNTSYPEFRKGLLRGIAAGSNSQYSRIGADASDANYSSMREERLALTDVYEMFQGLAINHTERPVFENWLELQLTATNNLSFTMDQYGKLCRARWQGRRWSYVDPLKEVKAIETALYLGLTSRKRELAKQGIDMDELDKEIEADENHPAQPAMAQPGDDDDEKARAEWLTRLADQKGA